MKKTALIALSVLLFMGLSLNDCIGQSKKALQNQITKTNKNVAELTSKVSGFTTSVNGMDGKVDSVEIRVNSVDKKVATVGSKIDKLTASTNILQESFAEFLAEQKANKASGVFESATIASEEVTSQNTKVSESVVACGIGTISQENSEKKDSASVSVEKVKYIPTYPTYPVKGKPLFMNDSIVGYLHSDSTALAPTIGALEQLGWKPREYAR